METSFTAPLKSSGDWTSDLDPSVCRELKRLHVRRTLPNLRILLLMAIWLLAGSLAVYTSLWVLKLLAWCLIGLTLHALAVFLHEGAHENIFQAPFIDRLLGFVCGLPVFVSCSNYRATHLLHHRFENTERDPDNFNQNFPNPWIRRLVFYSFLIVGMPLYILQITVLGPFRARGWRERLACVLEVGLMGAAYLALFTAAGRYGFWAVLRDGWLWALPVTMIVANIRGISEHTMLEQSSPPDPLRTTRTTRTHPIVSFFLNNQNFHLEHHLFPRVPWYNLPGVHRLLSPLYARREAAVATGYLQNLSDAFRYGPLDGLHYRADGSTLSAANLHDRR